MGASTIENDGHTFTTESVARVASVLTVSF
jgi:hypothetical protein